MVADGIAGASSLRNTRSWDDDPGAAPGAENHSGPDANNDAAPAAGDQSDA